MINGTPRYATYSTQMTHELYRQLSEYAERTDRSKSAAGRWLLAEALRMAEERESVDR